MRGASGRLVRVGDVARVDCGYADSTYRARFNGRRAVFVTASQRAGTTVQTVRDRINLLFTDTPFSLEGNAEQLSSYMTKLRQAVLDALHEEAVLIVAVPVYHAE